MHGALKVAIESSKACQEEDREVRLFLNLITHGARGGGGRRTGCEKKNCVPIFSLVRVVVRHPFASPRQGISTKTHTGRRRRSYLGCPVPRRSETPVNATASVSGAATGAGESAVSTMSQQPTPHYHTPPAPPSFHNSTTHPTKRKGWVPPAVIAGAIKAVAEVVAEDHETQVLDAAVLCHKLGQIRVVLEFANALDAPHNRRQNARHLRACVRACVCVCMRACLQGGIGGWLNGGRHASQKVGGDAGVHIR